MSHATRRCTACAREPVRAVRAQRTRQAEGVLRSARQRGSALSRDVQRLQARTGPVDPAGRVRRPVRLLRELLRRDPADRHRALPPERRGDDRRQAQAARLLVAGQQLGEPAALVHRLQQPPQAGLSRWDAGYRGQGNAFPLPTEKRRGHRPGEERQERPLLLHPYFDEPKDHLEFVWDVGPVEDGHIRPRRNGSGRKASAAGPRSTSALCNGSGWCRHDSAGW